MSIISTGVPSRYASAGVRPPSPGSFVREAAACAAVDDLYLYGGGLTPEPAELIKRTFRGVHLLAYLEHEELDRSYRQDLFDRAAVDARAAQNRTLGEDELNAATLDTPSKTSFGVADA